ncbi:MAG: hypothetical protein PHE47_03450 [Oscillospiraceae bacterium]|nr:hypothetical protein [Oscillospiraceae bacterium]
MDKAVRARQIYLAMQFASTSLPDEQAAQVPAVFPGWDAAEAYAAGDRVQYGERLYKCLQAHTAQADWAPDTTPSLWAVIDIAHAGTAEDPIPAARNMEYKAGRYYLDPAEGRVYLCSRDTGIPVAYLPHELVGQYF